jgi:hypothetical protein
MPAHWPTNWLAAIARLGSMSAIPSVTAENSTTGQRRDMEQSMQA